MATNWQVNCDPLWGSVVQHLLPRFRGARRVPGRVPRNARKTRRMIGITIFPLEIATMDKAGRSVASLFQTPDGGRQMKSSLPSMRPYSLLLAAFRWRSKLCPRRAFAFFRRLKFRKFSNYETVVAGVLTTTILARCGLTRLLGCCILRPDVTQDWTAANQRLIKDGARTHANGSR